MKYLAKFAASIALLLAGAAARAESPVPSGEICGLGQIEWQGELQSLLSQRAVNAITLATRGNAASKAGLRKLVAADAPVDLGAGDVGNSLGTGTEGLQSLAKVMQADAYRFQLWTWIPTSVQNPCGPQEISIEFTAASGTRVYAMKFAFLRSVIVSVKGWTATYATGSLP